MYHIVDVGCRWGFADRFLDHIDKLFIFGFDPDQEECTKLSNRYNHPHIKLIPYALLDEEKQVDIYITQNPGCSSIYPPDKFVVDTFLWCAGEHPLYKSISKTTTLDKFASDNGIQKIDYIKIDTQGAELLVLKGAKNILKTTSFIKVEVQFNPLYEGASLFSDIDMYLRSQGFVLYRFFDLNHYGVFGEKLINLEEFELNFDATIFKLPQKGGQLYWGDALYVKESIAKGLLKPEEFDYIIELSNILGYHDIAHRLNLFRAFKNQNDVNFLSYQFMLSERAHESSPDLQKELNHYKARLEELQNAYNAIINSRSYKLASFLSKTKKLVLDYLKKLG
jgi:FkbM family methyltransferase